MSFWETIAVGDVADIGTHLFDAGDIVRFAEKFDPQPFHLDAAAAKSSLLGGLCASGWHTAAVSMRLNVDYRRALAEAWVAAGNPQPKAGPSPGVTNLRWPKPVFAGDTVAFSQRVTAKRVSESRRGWGIIESSMLGVNQHGDTVFGFDSAVFQATD